MICLYVRFFTSSLTVGIKVACGFLLGCVCCGEYLCHWCFLLSSQGTYMHWHLNRVRQSTQSVPRYPTVGILVPIYWWENWGSRVLWFVDSEDLECWPPGSASQPLLDCCRFAMNAWCLPASPGWSLPILRPGYASSGFWTATPFFFSFLYFVIRGLSGQHCVWENGH